MEHPGKITSYEKDSHLSCNRVANIRNNRDRGMYFKIITRSTCIDAGIHYTRINADTRSTCIDTGIHYNFINAHRKAGYDNIG